MGHPQDAHKVRGILVAAGVPGDHNRPWHAMRHTFATLLAEPGASFDAISSILGHAGGGSAVTRSYVHAGVEFLGREIEKLRLMPGPLAHVLRIEDFRPSAQTA
jgi:site-specific recombinase XerD